RRAIRGPPPAIRSPWIPGILRRADEAERQARPGRGPCGANVWRQGQGDPPPLFRAAPRKRLAFPHPSGKGFAAPPPAREETPPEARAERRSPGRERCG